MRSGVFNAAQLLPKHVDPTSGLSYRNSTVRDLPVRYTSSPAIWLHKTVGTTKYLERHKNKDGAASLRDMAWRCVLCNLDFLTENVIQSLEWAKVEAFWKRIESNQLDSTAIWILFIRGQRDQIIKRQPHGLITHMSVRLPLFTTNAHTDGIIDYMRHLVSPSLEWITVLALVHHRPRNVQDWVQLANLSNLGALWVESDGPDGNLLNEVVIKEWAQMCKTSQGFANLKFLRILRRGKFDIDTTDIMVCLAALPALRIFHLSCWSTYLDFDKLRGQVYWLTAPNSRLCRILRGRNLELSTTRSIGAMESWKIIVAFDQEEDVDPRIQLGTSSPLLAVDGVAEDAVTWVRTETRPRYPEELWFERRQDVPLAIRRSQPSPRSIQAQKKPRLKQESLKNTKDLLHDLMR